MSNCLNLAYSNDNNICQGQNQWMRELSDNLPLSSLSIPGTHDTMSNGPGGDIAKTQSKNLSNQLNSGIRFLDIRLSVNLKASALLYLHHGPVYLNSTFYNVLDTVTDFLKARPSETVLMRVKQENSNVDDETFANTLKKVLGNAKYSGFEYNPGYNSNPKLGDMRRKFVILQNFGGNRYWMHYSSSFEIQDNYTVKTNWELYSKWVTKLL